MSVPPILAGVGRALPPHRYSQADLLAALADHWAALGHAPRRLARMHRAVQVQARHLALPIDEYRTLTDFGAANDAFIRVGTALAQQAVGEALADAGLAVTDIDAIFFTTVTGLATPTIDARLVNALGLRRDVKRSPFFGLGCVGGAAGVARMADYLRAYPDHVAALVSVELCSLTFQHGDQSVPNLISTGLFADGAAAVIGVGGARATSGPRVVASQSAFYPDSERIMGWDVGASGFRIVLSAGVPAMVHQNLRPDVDAFLAAHDLRIEQVDRWICHPGGPKVIDALQAALHLDDAAVAHTWRSLKTVGNLSSASVLFVLQDHLAEQPQPGEIGVLMAMGPGFCAELVLLRW